MISSQVRLEGTAIHEAAHAVVASELQVPVVEVVVEDADNGLCQVLLPSDATIAEWKAAYSGCRGPMRTMGKPACNGESL